MFSFLFSLVFLKCSLYCEESSQTRETTKALLVIQKMQSVLESLEDAAVFEMLPYIFHCFDMEDPTLTEQARIVRTLHRRPLGY